RQAAARSVGSKHFEKIVEATFFGIGAEFAESFQRAQIRFQIVVERHGIQAKIYDGRASARCREAAELRFVNVSGGERHRWPLGIAGSAGEPDVRRIVDAYRWSDLRAVEQSLLVRQRVHRGNRCQHHINESLANHGAYFFQEGWRGTKALARTRGTETGSAPSHVRIPGIGEKKSPDRGNRANFG